MGIQAAIYRNDLPCEVFAFVGCEVYAHGSNIIRRAIARNLDVIKEDVLQHIGHVVGVLFGDGPDAHNCIERRPCHIAVQCIS